MEKKVRNEEIEELGLDNLTNIEPTTTTYPIRRLKKTEIKLAQLRRLIAESQKEDWQNGC